MKPLKIKPDHFAHMRAAMIEILETWPTPEDYAARGLGDDAAKRHRWDVFNAAKLTQYATDVLYEYATDRHIDSALKYIVHDFYRHKGHIVTSLPVESSAQLTKITPDHMRFMRAKIASSFTIWEPIAKDPSTARQQRWAMFHSAGLDGFAHSVLYKYATDADIDVALVLIVKDMKATKANQHRIARELWEGMRKTFYDVVDRKAPFNWDGLELRRLLGDYVQERIVYPLDEARQASYLKARRERDI